MIIFSLLSRAFCQYVMALGKASMTHSMVTSVPRGAPTNWFGTQAEGLTRKIKIRKVWQSSVLTVNTEWYPPGHSWRHIVVGNAQEGSHLLPLDADQAELVTSVLGDTSHCSGARHQLNTISVLTPPGHRGSENENSQIKDMNIA